MPTNRVVYHPRSLGIRLIPTKLSFKVTATQRLDIISRPYAQFDLICALISFDIFSYNLCVCVFEAQEEAKEKGGFLWFLVVLMVLS